MYLCFLYVQGQKVSEHVVSRVNLSCVVASPTLAQTFVAGTDDRVLMIDFTATQQTPTAQPVKHATVYKKDQRRHGQRGKSCAHSTYVTGSTHNEDIT